ncbi:hypothetical protein TSUD_320040 [Trifolium subterraneum]|uniref:Reverse transcriptase domain-containing protein n=1 Tax=Trifolium subterraneum TaxID=3900 RepID=A0A2Z6NPT4_TRISU|nr:hypothetical protein TSUD_320040 [Trifolium subterraneum]
MVHSMHEMKGRKGAFVVKVDLSKAYDKISWEFIWRILCEIKLPVNMVNLIMHAVTSIETNVKWNGARAEYFRPQRGIRQGDPISPYLFVLCMDKLSHLILHVVNQGAWRGIQAGRNGPMVSHLMFADDLLLFGEATEAQMQCVTTILNTFCGLSGQEANQLSFDGRVTLAKSVLEAVPIYPVISNKIPKTCLEEIQRLQRNFIWDDTNEGRKFHVVSWEKICSLKWMRGLGLRNLEENMLIILQGLQIQAYGRHWKHVDIPLSLHGAKVSELVNNNGEWNWSLFQHWMPIELQDEIAAILPPNNENGRDMNKEAHETNFSRPVNPVQHVLKLSNNYRRVMHANTTVMQKERVLSYIKWKPPKGNFVKLNTDGACKEKRISGCGGDIRGNQGEWLRGFAKNVGNCSAFVAELWRVLEGLCLAQRMGFFNVELSIDSQAVVQVLKVGKVHSIHGMAILKRIRGMLVLNWVVEISHEYREANKCPDALANIGCPLDREVVFYEDCPFEIGHILLDDELGHSSPKLIVA